MTPTVYIYTLSDATGVRYVGKSSNPLFRFVTHRFGDSECARWIRAARDSGASIWLAVIEAVPATRGTVAERDHIDAHRAAGCDLLNGWGGSTESVLDEWLRRAREVDVAGLAGDAALRLICKRHGSAAILARLLGVGTDVLSRWMSGRTTPRPVMMSKIEDLLGVTHRAWLGLAYVKRSA